MDEDLIDIHLSAVEALLRPGIVTHRWEALRNPEQPELNEFPYVILWGDSQVTGQALGFQPTEFDLNLRITMAGIDHAQLTQLISRVRNDLIGKTPVIPGRSVGELRQEALQGIRPDSDLTFPDSNRHPLYAVDGYPLSSSAG